MASASCLRGWHVHGKYSISQFYVGKVAMSDSLSRIHEELSLEGQKYIPHTSECSWHLLHALRGWPIHGNNSISQIYLSEVAMTDSLSRIHEELSLKGQKQMSHTSECTWHLFHAVWGWPVHGKYESLNLSILYGKGGNKIFTIPISSFASNCKNRQQIQAIQTDVSDRKNR